MPDRYMMATAAMHPMGDISRDEPHLAVITGEDVEDFIGEWIEGAGFINVHFPKQTTRDLTADEREHYNGRWVGAGNGVWQIRILPCDRCGLRYWDDLDLKAGDSVCVCDRPFEPV